MNYNFLKEITDINKVGKDSTQAFFEVEYYTDENLNKMGYPKKGKINILREDSLNVVKNPALSQTNFFNHLVQKSYSEELSKLDTKGIVIDEDMTTTENKESLSQIDILIEKIASNIQSGAFFYIIVGDMYALLNLFQRTLYKFDYETLSQYNTYLNNLFDYLNEDKNIELYKIIGNEKQVRNLVKLVYDIYERIKGMFELMMKERYSPVFNRKSSLDAYIRTSHFKAIDTKYHTALKEQYDREQARLEYTKGEEKTIMKSQLNTLQELLARTPAPYTDGRPVTEDTTPTRTSRYPESSDIPPPVFPESPAIPKPFSKFDSITHEFFYTYNDYVRIIRESLEKVHNTEELKLFNDTIGHFNQTIAEYNYLPDETNGKINENKIERFGMLFVHISDFFTESVNTDYGSNLDSIGSIAMAQLSTLPAMHPVEELQGDIEHKDGDDGEVHIDVGRTPVSRNPQEIAILSGNIEYFRSGQGNTINGIFMHYFNQRPNVVDKDKLLGVQTGTSYVPIPASKVDEATEIFGDLIIEKHRRKVISFSNIQASNEIYYFMLYDKCKYLKIKGDNSPVIQINKNDSIYVIDTLGNPISMSMLASKPHQTITSIMNKFNKPFTTGLSQDEKKLILIDEILKFINSSAMKEVKLVIS